MRQTTRATSAVGDMTTRDLHDSDALPVRCNALAVRGHGQSLRDCWPARARLARVSCYGGDIALARFDLEWRTEGADRLPP